MSLGYRSLSSITFRTSGSLLLDRPCRLRPVTCMASTPSHESKHQPASSPDWRSNIITENEKIMSIAASARTVAVLGIKTEKQHDQPAFYVAEYLQRAGVEIIPVPVFYPDVTEILGKPVYRRVADIPGSPVDILDVFRKPSDIPAHLDDILLAKPKVVWLQSGISHPATEEALARAGIQVVVSRCLMVDHRASTCKLL